MADSLTEGFQRDWNLTNSDTNDYNNNNHVWQQRQLTRKVSDNNNSNNQQPQLINDNNNVPSLPAVRTRIPLSVRKSLEAAYDTDGAVGTSGNISKHHHHHHHSSNNYEHLISPRLPVRRPAGQLSRQTSSTPLQHQLTHKLHLSATPSISSSSHNHDDRDEDSNYEGDSRRRHIRLSRRVQQAPVTVNTGNHGTRINHLSILPQHGGPFVPSPSVQPLRIIFMRHGERANQALGPDWFNRAFRTNTYRPYDENLPRILPKRRFDQAYEFDAPLTVRGLRTARLTGRAMITNNYLADVCLSSTALRCVQTCERILTGMDRRDRIAIRIEPGLFECPHFNHKIIDSFMTKKELMENRYHIKQDYKPLISKVTVPETLEEYFERSAHVIYGIVERYGPLGGTVLIVTHAPGLLALTDALKGIRPNAETFYHTVATYPPLATSIAEYDGSRWRFSEQPFTLIATGQ